MPSIKSSLFSFRAFITSHASSVRLDNCVTALLADQSEEIQLVVGAGRDWKLKTAQFRPLVMPQTSTEL